MRSDGAAGKSVSEKSERPPAGAAGLSPVRFAEERFAVACAASISAMSGGAAACFASVVSGVSAASAMDAASAASVEFVVSVLSAACLASVVSGVSVASTMDAASAASAEFVVPVMLDVPGVRSAACGASDAAIRRPASCIPSRSGPVV